MESGGQSLSVAGRYIVSRQLAVGENGIFFAAMDKATNTPCIIKVYKTREESQNVKALEQELALVRHFKEDPNPFFVGVLDMLEEKNRNFVVFEKIEGFSIPNLIARHATLLKEKEILNYFQQIMSRVALLSEPGSDFPFVRLEPDNLMITIVGIRAIDFELELAYGASKIDSRENASFLQEGEVIRKLGKILYFLITEKKPEGEISSWQNPRDINPFISPFLFEVLKKCLDPRPGQQFESLDALRQTLLERPEERPEEKPAERFEEFSYPVQQMPTKRKFQWKQIGAFAVIVFFILLYAASRRRHVTVPAQLERKLLCAATGKGIEWLDLSTGEILFTMPIPGNFSVLVPWPQARKLILADSDSRTVFSVNPARLENASLLFPDISLKAYAFDPLLHLFFASNGRSPQVLEVAGELGGSVTSIPLSLSPGQLLIDSPNHRLYAAYPGSPQVSVISVLGNRVSASLTLKESPDLLYADSKSILVFLESSKNLVAYSTSGNMMKSIFLSLDPPLRLFAFDRQKEMVVLSGDRKLTFLDNHDTPAFSREVDLNFVPELASVDPDSGILYSTDAAGNLYAIALTGGINPRLLTKLQDPTSLALWNP